MIKQYLVNLAQSGMESFYTWLYGDAEHVSCEAVEKAFNKNRPALLKMFGCSENTTNTMLEEHLMKLESVSPCFLDVDVVQAGPIRKKWYHGA